MIEKVKDIDKIISTFDEDMPEFLPVFLREMDSCLVNLKAAIQAYNYLKARAELHQMLGASRIVKDEKLELLLLQVQSLVKSDQSIENILPTLSEVASHLDKLFHALKDQRSSYCVHVLDDQQKITSMIKERLLEEEPFKSVITSASIEECVQHLTSKNGDILIADCYAIETCLQSVHESISSRFSNLPILIFSLEPQVIFKKLSNQYENLNGYVHKTAGVVKLIEGIKIIANGRDFWL